MKKRLLLLAVVAVSLLAIGVSVVGAAPGTVPTPTGERIHAQSVLEPVFNAENDGQIGYVSTPNGTQHPLPSNPNSWSPFYVVEYPTTYTFDTSGSGATGPLNCWHMPSENCPTHGNDLAGIAQGCPTALPIPPADNPCSNPATAAAVQAVYQDGAAGHDHVMDFPGGADWNVGWLPIEVVFTDASYANTHRLLTDTAIDAAVAAGKAVEIPLPFAAFHCAWVPESVWALTQPFPTG